MSPATMPSIEVGLMAEWEKVNDVDVVELSKRIQLHFSFRIRHNSYGHDLSRFEVEFTKTASRKARGRKSFPAHNVLKIRDSFIYLFSFFIPSFT
jgi:hypothetical protein